MLIPDELIVKAIQWSRTIEEFWKDSTSDKKQIGSCVFINPYTKKRQKISLIANNTISGKSPFSDNFEFHGNFDLYNENVYFCTKDTIVINKDIKKTESSSLFVLLVAIYDIIQLKVVKKAGDRRFNNSCVKFIYEEAFDNLYEGNYGGTSSRYFERKYISQDRVFWTIKRFNKLIKRMEKFIPICEQQILRLSGFFNKKDVIKEEISIKILENVNDNIYAKEGKIQEVDSKIVPVIKWLDSFKSIYTINSCQGHDDFLQQDGGYVGFICKNPLEIEEIIKIVGKFSEPNEKRDYWCNPEIHIRVFNNSTKYSIEFKKEYIREKFIEYLKENKLIN